MGASASSTQHSEENQAVRAGRGPRNAVRPDEVYASLSEIEPDPLLQPARTWTLFLTSRECPWRCVMCDLWKNTLEASLQAGMIPLQIDRAIAALRAKEMEPARHLKLYNSGSFFDPRAIPVDDYGEIARRAQSFERLIVECHPSLIGPRLVSFLELLRSSRADGSDSERKTDLEVALGLETAHPEALASLNKGMTVLDFQEACRFLREHQVAIRVFLLLHPPGIPANERADWLQRSVGVAVEAGASVISLIPLRLTTAAMQTLAAAGTAEEPSLEDIESGFEAALEKPDVRVFLDLWDLERFSQCEECFPKRRARLENMNLQQRRLPKPVGSCRCGSLAS